jgi:hypothetical protein
MLNGEETPDHIVPLARAMMRGGTQDCAIDVIGLGTYAICELVFQLYEQNTEFTTQ